MGISASEVSCSLAEDEQEGRAWEEKFGSKIDADNDDGLGVYFAHCVTAAGWHSGALVLVNEDLAEQTRKNCLAPPPVANEIPKDDTVDAEGEVGRLEDQQQQQQRQPDDRTLLTRAASYAADQVRRTFGFPTSPELNNANPNPNPSIPRISARHDPNNPHAFFHPENHGAADGTGRAYAWANDPFPRLRLSDGREMPGEVEFSEWRFGRPEWDLNVEI